MDGNSTPTMGGKTWFTIDGSLEALDFEGPSYFRFPEELARLVIERFSKPGDLILDPFCGFGSALVAAQALGRTAIGIEKDDERARFAAGRVQGPSRVIQASATRVAELDLPLVDLIFTSPPYSSFREWSEEGFSQYRKDFESIFASLRTVMRLERLLVVELCNVREEDGTVRQVAFEGAQVLSRHFRFAGDLVRCNTGDEPAGPGYNYAHLFVYRRPASLEGSSPNDT